MIKNILLLALIAIALSKTCPEYSTYIGWNDSCLCWNGYLEVNGKCVLQCGENRQFKNGICSCIDGFSQINGVCSSCPPNSYYVKDWQRCVCNEGYEYDFKTQTKCQPICPVNSFYNQQIASCISCPEHSVYQQSLGQCVCYAGYQRIDGECLVICLAGYTRVGKQCIPNCPSHSTYNSNIKSCQCNQGYQSVNGQCVKICPQNEADVEDKCTCIAGYQRDGNGLCIPICQARSTYNYDSKQCVCNVGYTMLNGQCAKICPQNEVEGLNANDICICINGYQRDANGLCIPICQARSTYNYETKICSCNVGYKLSNGQCVKICPEDEIQGPNSNDICTCIAGYERDSNNVCIPKCSSRSSYSYAQKKCICNAGYKQLYGQCVKICGESQVQGPNFSDICVCIYGYQRDNNQICIPTCQNNAIYNYQAKVCTCKNGYKSVNGQCVKICPQNEADVEDKCTCVAGYQRDGNGLCIPICQARSTYNYDSKQCVCNVGYTMLNGQCAKICPQNEVEGLNANDICICINGYQRDANGLCIPICQARSTYNYDLKQCACNVGYTMINGQCAKICPQNEVEVQDKCVCIANYNRDNNGLCIPICPARSLYNYDLKQCLCNTGYQIVNGQCNKICPQNQAQSAFPPDICVCIAGYQRDSNGICIPPCPARSAYNYQTKQCQCFDGFKPYNGICTKICPQNEIQGPDNTCICPTGYQIDSNGNCIPNCPQKSAYDYIKKQCICINGYQLNAGICVKKITCPIHSSLDSYTRQCVCWNGYLPENGTGKCVRDCGKDKIQIDEVCVCIPGFHLINGICAPCPANSHYVDSQQKCICDDNYQYDYRTQSKCLPICPSGQHYSEQQQKCKNCTTNSIYQPATGLCRCYGGFQMINGICYPACQAGQTRVGIQCILICEPRATYDLATKQCICNQGYISLNGKCTKICPKNQIEDRNSCVCIIGYTRDQFGVCLPNCPQNSTYKAQSSKCECRQGYTMNSQGNNCTQNP